MSFSINIMFYIPKFHNLYLNWTPRPNFCRVQCTLNSSWGYPIHMHLLHPLDMPLVCYKVYFTKFFLFSFALNLLLQGEPASPITCVALCNPCYCTLEKVFQKVRIFSHILQHSQPTSSRKSQVCNHNFLLRTGGGVNIKFIVCIWKSSKRQTSRKNLSSIAAKM